MTDNPRTTQNELTHNMKFIIESRWKKFARIGILKEKDITFKECKTGEPIAAPGLSIADGILYLSDPSAISELENSSICLGAGPRYRLRLKKANLARAEDGVLSMKLRQLVRRLVMLLLVRKV